jgi:hypothetical protein
MAAGATTQTIGAGTGTHSDVPICVPQVFVGLYHVSVATLLLCLAPAFVAIVWEVTFAVRPLVAGQLRNELSGVLLPAELEWLLEQPHRPLALGQVSWFAVGFCRCMAMPRVSHCLHYVFSSIK